MTDPIRQVLVPDLAFEEATVTSNSQQGRRAPMSSTASNNGSLVFPSFADVESDEHGDGRPTFSGTPTDDESYYVDVTHPGVVGTSRFSLVSPDTAWAPDAEATYRKVKQSPLIAGQRVDVLESYYDDPDSANDYIGVRPKAVNTGTHVVVVSALTQHAPYDRYTKNPTTGALATRANEALNAVWVHRKTTTDQNWEFSDVVYLPEYGGIFDPVGILGLEYFADTDHLVLVMVYGTLALQGEVVTYYSEDLGETWTVGHTATIARDNSFDIKRRYEDTVKYAAMNAVAEDSDFRGTVQFSDGFNGAFGAFYVRVVKPGVVGLPSTPVDDCARVVWKVAGSSTWDQESGRLSRFEKGGRYTHLVEGVSVHFAQTVDRSVPGGVQYGRVPITSAFELGDILVLEYVAAQSAWQVDTVNTSASGVDANDLKAIQISFDLEHPENTTGSFTDGDRIAVSLLDAGWPGFSYSGEGLRFYAEYVDAVSWDPGSIPTSGTQSTTLRGVPVYSGQAIELTDAGVGTGVSVTFFHDSSANDLEFASEYTCTYDSRSYFHDIDVVRLSNDRLVALVTTSTGAFSMYSDDRGASWTTVTILPFGENVYAAGGAISLLCNGTLAASINPTLGWRAVPDPDPDDDRLSAPEEQRWNNYLYFSKDGETWSGPVLLDNHAFGNAIERRVVERPDGWPMLLSQQHYFYNADVTISAKNTVAGFDAVHERCFAVRSITGDEDLNTLFPSHVAALEVQGEVVGAEHWPFLWSSQAQRRGYQEGLYPVGYSGHAHGLAAVTYNGRLEVISPYVICAEDGTYPVFSVKGDYAADLETINEAVLRVYNTSYWTSVVEDLSFDQDNQYFDYYNVAWAGRSYQCSWDAGVDPENEDWDPGSGEGTVTQVYAADDNRGGYFSQSCSAGDSRIYSLERLPNSRGMDTDSRTSFRSCVRLIFKPTSGGSVTWAEKGDLVTAGLVLVDNNGEYYPISARWEVRCEVSGAGALTVRLFDAVAGTQIGNDYTASAGFEWLELLVATSQQGVSSITFDPAVYCVAAIRQLDHSEYETDFTWIEYSGQLLYLGGNASERIYWGCEGSAGGTTASCLWKAVHLHRGQQQTYILNTYAGGSNDYVNPLRWHTPFVPSLDSGFTSRFALPGAVVSDHGLNNPPLPPRTCEKPQYLRKGLSVGWEGNSKARLSWPVTPEYQYPAAAVNKQPVQRKYRSELSDDFVGDGPDQEYIVFDSGYAGGINAAGIAIFGNNFPQILVELSEVSDFSTGVSYRIGVPAGYDDVDYDCSLWSGLGTNFDAAGVTSLSATGNTLTVTMTSSGSPGWRPHQFYSHESGNQFYLAVRDPNAPENIKVTRILDNTEDALVLETTALTLIDGLSYSSIKMFVYSDRFAASTGLTGKYRYARISADATDVESPFTEWPVTFYPSTKRYWELGRVMLGRWFDINNPYIDWGFTYDHTTGYTSQSTSSKARFSKRQSTVTRKVTASFDFLHYDVRTESTRAVEATRTWQHMIDLLRRLEIDGRPCALVWEATEEDDTFFNGDPFEVLCVRAEIGNSTHTMYNNRTGSNSVCSPKPIMSLSGLAFTEED